MTAAHKLAELREAATHGVYYADGDPDYNGPQRGSAVIATDSQGAAAMVAVCWRPGDTLLISALLNATPQLIALIEAAEELGIAGAAFVNLAYTGKPPTPEDFHRNTVAAVRYNSALADLDRALGGES
jgi:hypothetical protein